MGILQKNYTMTDRSYGMYLAYITQAALGFNVLIAIYLGFGVASGVLGFLIALVPYLITKFTKIKFPEMCIRSARDMRKYTNQGNLILVNFVIR